MDIIQIDKIERNIRFWLLFCNGFAQIFDFAFGQLKSGLLGHGPRTALAQGRCGLGTGYLQFGCYRIVHRGFSFWSFKKCQEIDVERIFKKRMIFVKKSFQGLLFGYSAWIIQDESETVYPWTTAESVSGSVIFRQSFLNLMHSGWALKSSCP